VEQHAPTVGGDAQNGLATQAVTYAQFLRAAQHTQEFGIQIAIAEQILGFPGPHKRQAVAQNQASPVALRIQPPRRKLATQAVICTFFMCVACPVPNISGPNRHRHAIKALWEPRRGTKTIPASRSTHATSATKAGNASCDMYTRSMCVA